MKRMGQWLARRREEKVRARIQRAYDWAHARVKAGDLDFDDVIYRTRDATGHVLKEFKVLDWVRANRGIGY